MISSLSKFLRTLDPVAIVRLVLGGLAALFIIHLLASAKPWSVVVPEGRSLKLSQYVTIYFWWASAVNLVITGVMAATAPWWMRVFTRPLPAAKPEIATPKWLWPLVGMAMFLNAWFLWPQLGQSFWHDEAYPIRRTIVGHYERQPDGSLKLDAVKWRETLFYFKKPNHVLHSVICRIFNDAWRFFARPEGLPFNETAVRLPSFFAALAGVAFIALFTKRLGFPSAGVIAAFLFALHPWQIRYGAEARSYAFILALLPLLFYLAAQAVSRGRWRWWAGFAAAEFALMYFYPTSIYVLAVLNLAIPAAIWRAPGEPREKQTLAARWLAANIFAGMAFLQMMLPCVPQFLAYIKTTPGLGQVDFQWTQDFLSHLLAGISWNYSRDATVPSIELASWATQNPGLMAGIVFLAVSAVALGMRRLLCRGLFPSLFIAVALVPAIACYVVTRATSGHMYVWYIIFVLPGIIILASLGLDELLAAARRKSAGIPAIAALVLLLGAYAAWTMPQRRYLMERSMQPNRESVLLTRPTLNPHDPRQKGVITATFFGEPFPYDPNMVTFKTMAELAALIRQADAGSKALFINLGYLGTVEGEHPNKYRFLKESGLFTDLGFLPGFEYLQSRHVFQYKPGSAAGFDFTSVPPDRGSPKDEE